MRTHPSRIPLSTILAFLVFCPPTVGLTPSDVDSYFEKVWEESGAEPAPLVEDGPFLRRIYLDLAGTVPTPEEVLAFEEDRDPRKRQRVVNDLLQSEEYPRAWAEKFLALLFKGGGETKGRRRMAAPFRYWLERSLREGMPYDELVARILSARGPITENPEACYVAQFQKSPEALTGHASRVFLGAQIQCAQCHDHPFGRWTQKDFYGMHAFFARLTVMPVHRKAISALREGKGEAVVEMAMDAGADPEKVRRQARRFARFARKLPAPSVTPDEQARFMPDRDAMRNRRERKVAEHRRAGVSDAVLREQEKKERLRERLGPRVFVVVDRPRGEAILPDPEAGPPKNRRHPPRGETIRPRLLDGTEPPWPDGGSFRRGILGRWMRSDDNPYLARALVNRVWSWLCGQGLVNPVDNIVEPKDGAHQEMLEKIANHFKQQGYDLKGLIGLITSTKVYQRALGGGSGKGAAEGHEFSHATMRPLDPSQMLGALLTATGVGDRMRAEHEEQFDHLREHTLRQLSRVFENDGGDEQDGFAGTLTQALFLMNNPAIHKALRPARGSLLGDIVRNGWKDPAGGVERLYLAAYARRPGPDERRMALEFLAQEDRSAGAGPRGRGRHWRRVQAWSDLFWALLTSTEFLANH